MKFSSIIMLFFVFLALSCVEKEEYRWVPMKVTVSAYNSVVWQTEGDPNIAAWGDTLKPGMKSIAVSHDLVRKGLAYGTKVKIEGLQGVYLVNDKMHSRWANRIDLYMGKDVKKAKEWGRKKLTIHYAVKKDTVIANTK